jgi:peptide/nickel transport system permease protein
MSSGLFFYILKRILIMLPTLGMIAIICFLVLNLAPGRPGQQGEAQQDSSSEEARAQRRIFKEFFNYDRPVFLNDYPWLSTPDIQARLDVTLGRAEATNSELIDAQYELEDFGEYIVPQLIDILGRASDDPMLEAAVMKQLSMNGQLRNLFLGREDQIPLEVIQAQQRIGEHNQMLDRWELQPDTPLPEEHAALLSLQALGAVSVGAAQLHFPQPAAQAALWSPRAQEAAAAAKSRALERPLLRSMWQVWYAEHEARFKLSSWQSTQRLLFDTRFARYMGNLVKGDFGFTRKKDPVLPEILKRMKFSFILSFFSILLTYLLSIPIGVYSAIKQYTLSDRILTVTLFILYSLPTFFVGMLIVQYIPSGDPLFTSGFETSELENAYMTSGQRLWDITLHLILPVICLTYGSLAALSRYARTGLLDVIRADYIRTARAKGLSEPVVIGKHAMRNGMIPILTILGTLLPVLFGGSIVVESIFQIQGIGLYMLEAISNKDYAVIMAVLLISAVMTLIGLLISDISYALVDPRISFD